MNLIQCELIILNVKKKCFFAIRYFFATTPLLSSYHWFEKENVAYFSIKSRSFSSFSKVDFFYMESDLRAPRFLRPQQTQDFAMLLAD